MVPRPWIGVPLWLVWLRRVQAVICIGLSIIVALGPAIADVRASPQMPSATWAKEWPVIGPGATAQGNLSGLRRQGSAQGLSLDPYAADGYYESPSRDMGREFVAVGVLWQAQVPETASLVLELRRSRDGTVWEPWQRSIPDDAGPDGVESSLSHSELLLGVGRYVQLRATLKRGVGLAQPSLEVLKVVAIDSRQGPSISPAQAGVASSPSPPPIISRAAWGANESWMTWPPEYAPVLKFVIHHTATSNNEADPAATVRAIYYYHAVTLGWGDIGYNYLIDRYGRIYEGRAGGDGVIGGHARPYNAGTVGVAIVGDYSSTDVAAAAVTSLVELLAWKGNLHFVHPLQSGWLRDATFPNIMGHRDCNNTQCPGDRAYALLPQVRTRTFERMRAIPPRVLLGQPPADADVGGVRRVTWRASPAVIQLSIAVDGGLAQALAPDAAYWPWKTTGLADGPHRLTLVASTDLGQSASAEVVVRVDNTPPAGSLSAPRYTGGSAITLTLACTDCTAFQLGMGWRWEGEDLYHASGSGAMVSDPAAANGRAWLGSATDRAGPWFGPYFCGLPAPGDYEAVFWLRTARNDLPTTVAELDVADQAGTRVLAGRWPVATTDLAFPGRYQEFRLPFRYSDLGTSCRGGADDGLELRTWFLAAADLWLDRVEVYTAPQPFASAVGFLLPASEGSYPVEVRFLDPAGNASPVYTQTVTLDRTSPSWGAPTVEGLPVEDALSGLDASGVAVSLSDDGITWSPWLTASLALQAGSLTGLIDVQPTWAGRMVRARVCDRAGNVALSPAYYWPPDGPGPGPEPTPVFTLWVHCPLVTH